MKTLWICALTIQLSLSPVSDRTELPSVWRICCEQILSISDRFLDRMDDGLARLEQKKLSESQNPVQEELFARAQQNLQTEYHLIRDVRNRLSDFLSQTAGKRPDLQRKNAEAAGVIADFPSLSSLGGAYSRNGFVRGCPAGGVLDQAEDFLLDEGTDYGLLLPAQGTVSAGTWSYPSGSLHLGMDLALGMYTPLKAPAAGIVLYASTPAPDGGGYLGNWCGWPYGGGNTLLLLCRTQEKVYGISFFHLSRQILVRPGLMVSQGELIARSGNSGNSTGPHTHIEIFEIRVSAQQAVQYFQNTADFSFGCGWDRPAACSDLACRIRPERIFESGRT